MIGLLFFSKLDRVILVLVAIQTMQLYIQTGSACILNNRRRRMDVFLTGPCFILRFRSRLLLVEETAVQIPEFEGIEQTVEMQNCWVKVVCHPPCRQEQHAR